MWANILIEHNEQRRVNFHIELPSKNLWNISLLSVKLFGMIIMTMHTDPALKTDLFEA